MEKYVLPISTLLLAICALATIIREAFEREKLPKFKFILISLITVFIVLVIAFIDKINTYASYIIIYIMPIIIVVIGIIMFNSIYVSILAKKINSKYLECATDQIYFAYLNKLNKIINMSDGFSKFLNIDVKNLKNIDFKEALEKEFSNIAINGIAIEDISDIFSDVSNSKEELNYEITCFDKDGNKTILNLIDKPIYQNETYKGHILYGASLNHNEIDSAKEAISEKNDKLEMNRLRFMTLLEKGKENIYIYNFNNKSIWASDAFTHNLGFAGNSISFDDYKRRIHPDDLRIYVTTLESLTPTNPSYDVKYRFKCDNVYVYVHDTGKKIFGVQNEIISVVTKSSDIFQKSGISILDKCADLNALADTIDNLKNSSLELVLVNFENVKEINDAYSRLTGSEAMSDYIREFARTFIDNNQIYRLDGLLFGFVVTSQKKIMLLKQSLDKGMLTSATCTYGGIKITLSTTIAVSSNKYGENSDALVKNAKKALKEAKGQGKKYKYFSYN